jgi:hypothetical protein
VIIGMILLIYLIYNVRSVIMGMILLIYLVYNAFVGVDLGTGMYLK